MTLIRAECLHLDTNTLIMCRRVRADAQTRLHIGHVQIVPLEDEDLTAASVVLTRSFATSVDSVRTSLSKVE